MDSQGGVQMTLAIVAQCVPKQESCIQHKWNVPAGAETRAKSASCFLNAVLMRYRCACSAEPVAYTVGESVKILLSKKSKSQSPQFLNLFLWNLRVSLSRHAFWRFPMTLGRPKMAIKNMLGPGFSDFHCVFQEFWSPDQILGVSYHTLGL